MLVSDCEKIVSKLSKKLKVFKNKRILLTGALGFIGLNFLKFFDYLNKNTDLNIKIIAIDNKKPNKNHRVLLANKNIIFKRKNLENIKKFPEVNYVIHTASIASPVYYRKKPLETIYSNVFIYKKILDFYKNKKLKSLLYFSSSEIYGNPDKKNIPTDENYNGNVSPIGPRSCYDESKRFGETLSVYYYKLFHTPIKIIRPFNNFGPELSLHDGRISADVFNAIITNNKIKLYSDGKSTRTYCYIADAIYGYLLLLLSNFNAEPFNIGNDKPEITVNNFVKKCIKISKQKNKIIFKTNIDKNYNIDSPTRRCPDIRKAKIKLGFEPFTKLEDGIKKTLIFYRKQKN